MIVSSRAKEAFNTFLQSPEYQEKIKPSLESVDGQNIMKHALQVGSQILETKRQSDIVLGIYSNIPCSQ